MKLMVQVGIVFGVCLIGQTISALLPIAVPGSVLSMIVLFAILVLRIVKVDHIRLKADFLLKNMAFFFIPAGVGIIADFSKIQDSILPLLAVVVITTFITFAVTAVTVRSVMALQNRLTKPHRSKRHA